MVDWLHMLAAAAWLGALPALLVLASRGRAAGGPGARPLGGALLRRHGGLALVAAPLVALTGIANSPLVLGTPRDVVGSDYGNLLLAKATLLAVALGVGAVNHLALRVAAARRSRRWSWRRWRWPSWRSAWRPPW